VLLYGEVREALRKIYDDAPEKGRGSGDVESVQWRWPSPKIKVARCSQGEDQLRTTMQVHKIMFK